MVDVPLQLLLCFEIVHRRFSGVLLSLVRLPDFPLKRSPSLFHSPFISLAPFSFPPHADDDGYNHPSLQVFLCKGSFSPIPFLNHLFVVPSTPFYWQP